MDLALTINAWIDEEVIFAHQLGARQVFAAVDPAWGDAPGWDARALGSLANRVEKGGLSLAGLHLAGVTASEPLAWIGGLIADAGAAGIGLLSLSARSLPARRSSQPLFPAAWLHLTGAADAAGIRLALPASRLLETPAKTPAQAAAEMLRGLPAGAGLDAPSALLDTWLVQPDSETRRLILDRLFLASFENERQVGEQDLSRLDDLLPLSWRLRQAGYPGLIRLGRPARWKGDTRESHHARAFSTGYLRGVFQTIDRA